MVHSERKKTAGPLGISLLFLACAAGCLRVSAPDKSVHSWFAMDTDFSVSLYGKGKSSPESAFQALQRESARLELIFSDFLPYSALSRLRGKAGDTLPAEGELYAILRSAQEAASASGGSFDITLHALKAAWGLASGDSGRVPAESAIATALRGNPAYGAGPDAHPEAQPPFRLLEGGRVVLLRDSLVFDLGGIAKGYAVDRMHAMLDSLGFSGYLVQAGGDMRLGGIKGREGWRIGIRHPRRPDTLAGLLGLDKPVAISTSGDYERFFLADGVRYHHIFDPRTGRPARPFCSVTVLADRSELADRLTKPLFILGPERGRELLARFAAEAVWMREAPGGLCHIASPGLAGKLTLPGIPACGGALGDADASAGQDASGTR